jgi:hypothetical protein
MLLNLSILAIILLLAPQFYLLLASPALLFVSLDIPQVAYIFRSNFLGSSLSWWTWVWSQRPSTHGMLAR